MEAFVLLGGFALIAVGGYYVMVKIDLFLDKVRRQNIAQEKMLPFHVATSCFYAIPSITTILNDIGAKYPDMQCDLSFGQEQEVIKAFDTGNADVAIVSSQAESGVPAQWECVIVNPRPVLMMNGSLPVKTFDQTPRYEKILWKNNGDHFLAAKFVRQFCGH